MGAHLSDRNWFQELNSAEKSAASCWVHTTVARGASTWCKLVAIADALSQGHSTVVHVDSDAFFDVDDQHRLSAPQILEKHGGGKLPGSHPVWCPADGSCKKFQPNVGMQVWSNTAASRALLRAWWATDVTPKQHAHEQTAVH